MIRRMTLLALVLMLTFVTGLATAAAAAPTPPPAAAVTLEGTHWNVVEIAGVEVQAGPRILLERKKAKRQLSGATGCALIRGSYDLFAGRLRIAPEAPKKTACSETLLAQETAFLAALRQTADYRIANDALTLLSADGHALARFTRSVP
jgi:heat shock protein HslJ